MNEAQSGDKKAYQAFFQKALKKFGVKGPDELEGDKKKEFFDYVDKNWKGDDEKNESTSLDARMKIFKEKLAKLGYKKEVVNEAKMSKEQIKKHNDLNKKFNDLFNKRAKYDMESKEWDKYSKEMRDLSNQMNAITEAVLDEAKGNAPFKELEGAWKRAGGDEAKEAKLIKKHNLQPIFSANRPGSIKLGILNKLEGSREQLTLAGLDDDDKLVFVTNHPIKIYYPTKGTHRPKGKGIKSIWEQRVERLVTCLTEETDEVLLESFVRDYEITLDMKSSVIKEKYNKFLNA